MVDNIEKVLERGERIELLVDKTDNLRFQVLRTSQLFSSCPGMSQQWSCGGCSCKLARFCCLFWFCRDRIDECQ